MLLELALWLGKDARFFNVFGYLTLRTMLAAGTALLLSLIEHCCSYGECGGFLRRV